MMHDPQTDRRWDRYALPLLLAGFFPFYLWHSAPPVQWGDPAKLLWMAAVGGPDLVGPGGHGLLILCIRALDAVLPDGIEIAARLVSPIMITASLAILWRVMGNSGIGLQGRVLALSALGVSHLFWFVAEIIESYSIVALTFALWLWAVQAFESRPSILRGLRVHGAVLLGLLNHHLFLLLVPISFAYVLFILPRDRRIAWLIVHGLPAAAVLGIALIRPDLTRPLVDNTAYAVSRWVNPLQGARWIVLLPVILLFQFPGIPFLCGTWGAWQGRDRRS